MNNKKRGIIIATFGTAALAGVIYLIIRKIKNDNKFADLMLSIQQGAAQEKGDIGYLKAFDPKYFQEPMGGKAIILYKAAKLQELVDALQKAMKGAGTKETKINSIYAGIENQKKMSQVANAYAVKYGKPLIDKLKSELLENERETLFKLVAGKPLYQLST